MSRVSVIMSVYKEPVEWLRQSIDSILTQTFPDFEFIIVNDCPEREDHVRILNEYQQQESRIVIITNDKNIGLTQSLNKALSLAKGEYIARMDADDISMPERFGKQVAYLDNHADICAVGTWIVNIDEKGKLLPGIVRYDADPRWVKAQMLQNSQLCHPSAMFRRMVKNHVAQYDETLRYAQDYALWVSLLPYGEIANIPEVLLQYRTSNKQITSNNKAEQQACAAIVQKRAFELFGFSATESFSKMFFKMTIQHRMDLPSDEVKKEFKGFFKNAKLTKANSLALEMIYSTYFAYWQSHCKNSKKLFVRSMIASNSAFMLYLGCKLIVLLYQRKAKRK